MMRRWLLPIAVCALLQVVTGFVFAADAVPVLADPTQPPASVLGPDGAEVTDSVSTGLTSVMLPKKGGGRPTAVINGQVVAVGEMVGEARLVRLTETEAVLEGPDGVERLYLTPNVEKKMSVKMNVKKNVTQGAVRPQKDKQ